MLLMMMMMMMLLLLLLLLLLLSSSWLLLLLLLLILCDYLLESWENVTSVALRDSSTCRPGANSFRFAMESNHGIDHRVEHHSLGES